MNPVYEGTVTSCELLPIRKVAVASSPAEAARNRYGCMNVRSVIEAHCLYKSVHSLFLSLPGGKKCHQLQNGVGEKFCCVTVARLEVSFVAESIPTEAFAVIIQRQTGILRSLDSCFFFFSFTLNVCML